MAGEAGLRGGRLFVVSGPSGAGKGTVVKGALAKLPDVQLSVSATTRPARPGERQGIEYSFISDQMFRELRDQGEFIESAEVYGALYGTPRGPVDRALAGGRNVVCELDIQGATAIKRAIPASILIFIEPPSMDELYLRLRGRGTDDPETIAKRVQAAYSEVKKKGMYDHLIVNDELSHAIDELVRIISG